jgi:putative membrane protein insertion efficiency factor
MIKRILLRTLELYRYWISPAIHALSPTGCKFEPSCSSYASEAITLHGASRGGWLAFSRLLRCHPFSRGGFDPVPLPRVVPPAKLPSRSETVLHDPLP